MQFTNKDNAQSKPSSERNQAYLPLTSPTLTADEQIPTLGSALKNLRLHARDMGFVLPDLALERMPKSAESGADACTPQSLWELDYHLQMQARRDAEVSYDELTLPKIPARGLYTEQARQQRLVFAREQTGARLADVEQTRLDPRKLVSNIEAFIGTVEVPVGLAGPLHIKGEHAVGLFYTPMATSEGALLASATRGAIALSRSGGVTTRVISQRMMRVPLFAFGCMQQALFFADWVQAQCPALALEVGKFSNFAKLIEVQAQVMGRNVHVHFIYETGDAAGQNMTDRKSVV